MINWKTLPRERGIYQITTGSVSYIGLSDNIQLRIKQHLDSSSCRSRIILDTDKAKIIVLELLPNSDDKTLALREWYWFSKLKRKGHIMVNDPKTLGKTKSGQFFPPENNATNTSSLPRLPVGCSLPLLGITTVIIGFFSFGFFAAGKMIQQTASNQTNSNVVPQDSSEKRSVQNNTGKDRNSASKQQQIVEMEPLSACITPLQPGTSKEAVKVLQRQLKQLGYYEGSQDGIYGPGTEESVSEFQRDYNLNADGVVGCNTQAKINQALP
ncbi:MAG: peptidoglycan-binding protein [Cyanobacteria bacterium SW_9_44_58]|nr:MAG: peptidoglycan-binding protein [Cyanobacteria bacterium SW_9_44_58]